MRWLRAVVFGFVVAGVLAIPTSLGADVLPSVTVVKSADGFFGPSEACSDAILNREPQFHFSRTGDVSAPLTVAVAWSGDAVAGDDYVPPSTTIDFAAGETSAEVSLARGSVFTPPRVRTVTATIGAGAGYEVGSPASADATITYTFSQFSGCPVPAFSDASTNTSQIIPVGGLPLPLVATIPGCPSCLRYALLGGELPPGVALKSDGTFGGAATTIGVFTSDVEVCAQFFAGRECDRTSLTIQVVAQAAPRFTG